MKIDESRCWPEDSEHENGNYLNRCVDCAEYFIGHKRRLICKTCYLLLEPDRGNLYRPHALMVDSGQFWRCKHGHTGIGEGWSFIGCEQCASEDPEAKRLHDLKYNK